MTALLGAGSASAAKQPSLTQQILPLNCIFNVVDQGTQELVYLTPEECGQAVPPVDPPTPTDPSQPQLLILPIKPSTPAYPPGSGSGVWWLGSVPSASNRPLISPTDETPSQALELPVCTGIDQQLLNIYPEFEDSQGKLLDVAEKSYFCYQIGYRDGDDLFVYGLYISSLEAGGIEAWLYDHDSSRQATIERGRTI